jgi:hypothetical protein
MVRQSARCQVPGAAGNVCQAGRERLVLGDIAMLRSGWLWDLLHQCQW